MGDIVKEKQWLYYIQVPISLFRGFMTDDARMLMTAAYIQWGYWLLKSGVDQQFVLDKFEGIDRNCIMNINRWPQMSGRVDCSANVHYSISYEQFELVFQNLSELKPEDKLMFLCEWALKTIGGKHSGQVVKATNKYMFARMAGYRNWEEYDKANTTVKRTVFSKFTGSSRQMLYWGKEFRTMVMQGTGSNFHFYKGGHVRGFLFLRDATGRLTKQQIDQRFETYLKKHGGGLCLENNTNPEQLIMDGNQLQSEVDKCIDVLTMVRGG